MTLMNTINSFKNEQIINTGNNFISFNKSIINKIDDNFNITINYALLTSFIIKKFEYPENINGITSRKFSKEFFDETGIPISKTTIRNKMRN